MNIITNDNEKIAMFYISQEENSNDIFLKQLDNIILNFNDNHYLTAICVSGNNPIEDGISELIHKNLV